MKTFVIGIIIFFLLSSEGYSQKNKKREEEEFIVFKINSNVPFINDTLKRSDINDYLFLTLVKGGNAIVHTINDSYYFYSEKGRDWKPYAKHKQYDKNKTLFYVEYFVDPDYIYEVKITRWGIIYRTRCGMIYKRK
jgi:hypothetical protein